MDKSLKPPIVNIGDRFGMLTIKDHGPWHPKKKLWLCVCDCGNEKVQNNHRLCTGVEPSCGCNQLQVRSASHTIHGAKQGGKESRTYKSWHNMKARCYYQGDINYKNYGGRGIKVCDRWIDSFPNFLADMGERPAGMSLDRIRVYENYGPDNCKWSTTTEQNRNRRDNFYITIDGVSKCLSAWCEQFNIDRSMVRLRIVNMGWDVMKALTTPSNRIKKVAA